MKKYRLKKWVKVVMSLIIILMGILIYHFLGIKSSFAGESKLGSIFICLGWFWLTAGQFILLYAIWEN